MLKFTCWWLICFTVCFVFWVWLSSDHYNKSRQAITLITTNQNIRYRIQIASTYLILKSTSIPIHRWYLHYIHLHTTRILQCIWPMTFFYNLTFAHRPIGFCSSMCQRWNFIGPSLLRHHCDAINVRSNTTTSLWSIDQCVCTVLFSFTVGFICAKISTIISTHRISISAAILSSMLVWSLH